MKEDTTIIDSTWIKKTGGYARDMTLRDHFAANAMQALLAYEESTLENDAEVAYQMADAMLRAREAK